MKLKKIITLVFLLFMVNSAKAFFGAYAKYNPEKTYYFVSIPNDKPLSGYTAVFDAKTNQLQFKIDTYFPFGCIHLFLSNDGTQLVDIETVQNTETETDNCCFIVYEKNKNPKRVHAFSKKIRYTDFMKDYALSNTQDVIAKKDYIDLITIDSTYRYQFKDQSVVSRLNDTIISTTTNPFKQVGEIDRDSIFNLSDLQIGKQSFTQKLASDLTFNSVSDKEKASTSIFLDVRLFSDGHFEVVQIKVVGKETESNSQKTEELKKLITHKISSYKCYAIPRGVDYWVFSGRMYVTEE